MASRGGGHSPAPVGRGSGFSASGVGRARSRGRAAGRAQDSATPQSQQLSRSPGAVRSLKKPPHFADEVTGTDKRGNVIAKAHLASLASDVDIDAIKAHFSNMCRYGCDEEVELSNAVILGGGKAEIVLKGLSDSGLEMLKSRAHKIKSTPVEVDFEQLLAGDEGPPPLEGDSDGDEEEKATAIIEVGNVPKTVSIGALKTYFETARSGSCDDAVANITNIKPGMFHVTFHDHKVAAQVTSEPRKFKKEVLEIRLLDEADSEATSNEIEVHNVPENVTEKVLKTYFEVGKSGGCPGAVADCRKINEGTFIVTFHDPSVAAQVMSTTPHIFKKASLSLKYAQHVKQKGDYRMDQLVIRGLPDGVEKEIYEVIIADCLNMEEDDNFKLAIGADSSAVITFAKCYPAEELQAMVSAIASTKVEDTTVTVEMVKVAKLSIHISNITTLCTKKFMDMYFSDEKESGGGEIDSVTICSSSEAIVTFTDPAVNQSVLKRSHPALGPEAVLVEYNGESTKVPEPLEIPLDPLIAQSIKQCPNSLEQSIHASHVMISTDEEKGLLVLSPSGKSKPNWRQECEELVPQYIAEVMKKEKVKVQKEVAKQAKESVIQLQKENPSLSIAFNSDGTEITIAGETSCVLKAKETINSVCLEQVIDTVSIPLAPEDYDFLEQVKHHEFPASVECAFDPSNFAVVLKGPAGIVAKLKHTMEEIVGHEDILVVVDHLVTEFFVTNIGRGKLEKLLQDRQCHTALHFSKFPLSLHFVCDAREAKTVKAIVWQLRMLVTSQTIPIPDTVVSFISDLEEFAQVCQDCEQKHGVLVKHVGNEVSAAGFSADVTHSLAEIKQFLVKMASPLPPLEINVGTLVVRSINRSQQGLQKCLEPFHVSLQCDAARRVLLFSPSHYLKPDWELGCKKSVSEYIQSNIAEQKVVVPKDAYQEIMSVLYSAEQEDGTFVFYYPPNSTSLSFAGEPNTVKLTDDKISQICTSHSFVRDKISLKPEVYEYLIQLKIEELISKSGVEIEPVPESQALILSGVSKSVKAVKDSVQTLTAQVLAAPVEVGEAVVQFLASEKGRERLISLLREKRGDKCAILISDSAMKLSILYIPKNKDAVKKASKAIVESTSVLPLNIPDLLLPFLAKLPDMRYEVERLQEEHSAMISVKDREIVVAGFKDGVSQAADAISSFVKAKEAHFRPFSIPIDGMIAECIKDDQEGLQACVSKLCIKCTLKVEKGKSKAKAALCASPTIATPVNWKENCKPLLTSYIDKEYVQDRIQIFKEAASDVYPILMSTQTNSNFIFTTSEDGAYTIVAGRREVVETFRRKLDDIYNSKQTSMKFELPKRKYDFFTQVIQPTIESGIMIKCLPEKYSVTVFGSIHDVSNVMKSMEDVKFSIVPVIVDAVAVKFISTTGRKSLETSIQKAAVKAAIHINTAVHPPTLELLCHHKFVQKIEQLKETFPKQIKMCTVSLPKSVAESAEELHEHCQQLMKKHAILLIPKSDVLQICGFTNIIGEVEKSIEMFIKKKCTVCRSFPIQRGMWRLLNTHMRQRWAKIESLCHDSGVTLQTPSNVIQIDFKGDKVEVQKVTQAMNHLVRSINKSTVPLTRKEIRQYFNEGEDGFCKVPYIERNAKVCIEVCVVGEDMACGIEEDMNTARLKLKTTKHHTLKLLKECTAQVVDMKRITIYVGDITEFRADVIVNAANEDLKHIGGVADAILKKGGQEIQDVSDRYTRSHGRLRAGDVWLSPTTGRLSCLALIHAVGPRWHGNPSERQQLKKVCNNCLVTAREYSSIALPAISSGVFGCPIDQCAEVMISTIVAFCNTQRSTALDDINIVVFKPSDAEHFVQALYKQLPRESVRKRSESSTKPSNDSASYLPSSVTVYDSESDYLITSEMYEEPSMPSDDDELPEPVSVGSTSSLSRVLVQQGSILDVEAEIYVNSTNGNMDLSGGAVAKALDKAAGPSLQAECTKKAPIAAGEIAVTGPGNIRRCKCIIHINCPGYDKTGKAEEMLRTIMNRCMRECDRQGASTIVFPAIGTGNLGFPVEIAAHIMVDEVCNYLQKNKCKSLSMVYFIIFMKNMYRTFCDELEKRKKVTVTVPLTNVSSSKDKEKRSKKKTKKSGQRRGRRLEESLNISPHNITSKAGNQPLDLRNGITVEILKGDITAEKTDVIVNSTDKQMRLMGGGVSAALAKKAGAELQRACDEIKPKKKQCLEQGKVLDTRSGNLQCKRVFHIVYHSNFVTIIRSCIERAVELKYTSIAFPGIGTGAEGCPADTAAKEMIKGLQQCTTTYSMHVRIVLFQDEVYKAFRAVIDSDDLQLTWYQRAGRAVRSLIPWSPAYEEGEEAMDINVPENENEEDTELRIFGETEEQVFSAENSLNTLIKKQFTTVEIEDDRICLLHEIQETDLKLKARRMQIVFHIDRNLSSIELKGSKESIAEMRYKILDALNKAEKEASRKTQAETMMQTVKWVRQDSSETQYDPVTNLEIEAASRSGESTYKFTDAVSGENFTINFKEMVEIDHTMGDKKFYIQRVVEGAEGGLPNDWEPMVDPTSKKEVPLRVVDLPVASRGYKFALAEFHKTMTQGINYNAIVKIERIQNPALYGQYAAKKAQLDAHNPQTVQNERWLFHGTKESSVAKINKTNFNRSFRGQNGTAYGQGTYFARDASYSNQYSSPNSQGQKRMYLVRVLAGEYIRGANSMIVAPPKDPSDETVLFDSVVDNPSNPSIFVVFYDGDAYPEYLITYT